MLQKIINTSTVFVSALLVILSQFFISIKISESGEELSKYFEFIFNLSGYSGLVIKLLFLSIFVFITSCLAGYLVNKDIEKKSK